MADTLRLYQMVPRIRSLGPFLRLGVWTQGCLKRCPGCVSPESRPLEGGRVVPVDAAVSLALKYPEQEGITVSGGEPFLQAEALCLMIDRIRARRDMGVILYTGYTLEELQGMGGAAEELLGRLDLMIDGPYERERDDGGALRGYSNQRALALTDRYRDHLADYGAPGRQTELRYTESGFALIGIPKGNRE